MSVTVHKTLLYQTLTTVLFTISVKKFFGTVSFQVIHSKQFNSIVIN